MRILFVTPFLPDVAAPHGGGIALGTLAVAMARRAELGVVALESGPAYSDSEAPWSRRWLVPHEPRPAGPRRLLHQLRMLRRWRQLPLLVAKYENRAFANAVSVAVRDFAPTAVFVEMAHMAQYLPLLGGVPTVLTDHEAGVPANTRTGLGPLGDRRDRRLWEEFLDRYYPLASALQAVTPEDAEVLGRRFHRPCAVRRPLVPVAAAPVAVAGTPPRALFLGDYAHGPNPEAAAALVQRVWPQVLTRVPDAELWFAGAHHERIRHLGDAPGVRIVGFVPDLGQLMAEVRLVLAPIYSGSGVRTKCISAMAHGLPVVTNPLGARGCDAPGAACRVGGDDDALAALTAELLASPAAAQQAGAAAHAWARASVDADAIAATQLELAAAAARAFAAR